MQTASPRSHRFGLQARVTVVFTTLAFVLSSVLALFSYELTRTFLISRRESTAQQQAYLNARAVRDALVSNAYDVKGALDQLQTSAESAAAFRTGDQWFGTSVGVGRDTVPSELRRLVAQGVPGTQYTTLGPRPSLTVGVPLPAANAAYFEFIPVTELDQTLSLLARSLFAAVITMSFIGAFVGRYAAGRVLLPIGRVTVVAREIASGELDRRLDAEGDSDLVGLVEAFNDMVQALHDRIELETRFASDVSHELRTPLAAMQSALNVARRRSVSPESDAALDVIEGKITGFTRLVLDLLEISRMEAGVSEPIFEPVIPFELITELLDTTHRQHVPVEVSPSTPPSVLADRRRIYQVVANLCDNADAYGNGVTKITLTGSASSLRIAVEDRGPGVSDTDKAVIFERFVRGDDASARAPGSGLGLSLAVEHLRQHGGRVWVEDVPAGGARFVIEIPSHP